MYSLNILVYPILRIISGMAGKLCNVVAFGAFYVWTGELYPTSIRCCFVSSFILILFIREVSLISSNRIDADAVLHVEASTPMKIQGSYGLSSI